jgi:hypothetical protein
VVWTQRFADRAEIDECRQALAVPASHPAHTGYVEGVPPLHALGILDRKIDDGPLGKVFVLQALEQLTSVQADILIVDPGSERLAVDVRSTGADVASEPWKAVARREIVILDRRLAGRDGMRDRTEAVTV